MSVQPPWHLWGNTQTFTVPAFAIPAGQDRGFQSAVQQGQLCRVPYLRPDTFHWLFSSVLQTAADLSGVTNDVTATLEVHFDLIVGVGRSAIVLPDFDVHTFRWVSTDPTPPATPLQTFTTNVVGRRNWTSASGFDATLIDEITAQDIQLTTRTFVSLAGTGADFEQPVGESVVAVSAHFAPQTHIRPDWYLEHFPGHEQGTAPPKPPPLMAHPGVRR